MRYRVRTIEGAGAGTEIWTLLATRGAEGNKRKTNDPGPAGGSGSLLSVVAGEGFEPSTFRL